VENHRQNRPVAGQAKKLGFMDEAWHEFLRLKNLAQFWAFRHQSL
jgi:hypothetical protein